MKDQKELGGPINLSLTDASVDEDNKSENGIGFSIECIHGRDMVTKNGDSFHVVRACCFFL